MRLWQRLWWRIWLAVLAAIALVSLVSFGLLRLALDPDRFVPPADLLAQRIAAVLPSAAAPPAEQQAALEGAVGAGGAALFTAERQPIARAGRWMPPPRARYDDSHWLTRVSRDDGAAEAKKPQERLQVFALKLEDGRWLVAGRSLLARRPVVIAFWFVLLAVGAALGAYPVARRLTRRLEQLQRGVDELGRGDLTARVQVGGRDEVAQLAASFNTAATRIGQLLDAQRALLANASHELRSPLARIRLALELLDRDGEPERQELLKRELRQDIAELDELIDEILLTSRLDAQDAGREAPFEPVDLTALAAEECARAAAPLDAETLRIAGDPRLLRRLLRNLLDNARRHAPGTPPEVRWRSNAGQAELVVADRGPGVAEAERQRIFEPFYRARGVAESAGGVGLGLALVARIARRHGGSATCRPRTGGGTEFVVSLPLGPG